MPGVLRLCSRGVRQGQVIDKGVADVCDSRSI